MDTNQQDIGDALKQQQRKLEWSRRLLRTNGGHRGKSNLTRALALASAGTRMQVVQVRSWGQETEPSMVIPPATLTPNHTSPSAAALALLHRHDVTPTPEQTAEIRTLDDLPEPTRRELTDYLNAYLAYETATRNAYADANWTGLRAAANYTIGRGPNNNGTLRLERQGPVEGVPGSGNPSSDLSKHRDSLGTSQGGGIDSRPILTARIGLLAATGDLGNALARAELQGLTEETSHGSHPAADVQIAPVLSIGLSNHDDNYTKNYAVQLDAGGNDTYLNNAGGNNVDGDRCTPVDTDTATASALVDFRGADVYNNSKGCGQRGGAFLGTGFLLDAGSGDDTYTGGGEGANGTNGGGKLGVGFLLDAGGDDSYTAGNHGTNGGGDSGIGFLLDVSGDDSYSAGSAGTNGGGYSIVPFACCRGGGFLDETTSLGGVGFLHDASGEDTYDGGETGTNGGVMGGKSGFLLDGAGNDQYLASCCGSNGAALYGYCACPPFTNSGTLIDVSGDDVYRADGYSERDVNGGAYLAAGLLADGGGKDVYVGGTGRSGDSFLVRPRGLMGVQVDLPVTSRVGPPAHTPTPPSTPTPTPTPTHGAGTTHAEGTCDAYDEDGNGGTAEDTDGDRVYGSIQSAEDAVEQNASVLVHRCTYNASVNVDTEGLVLSGVGEVVLEGRNDSAPAFNVTAPDVSISGFHLRNYSTAAIVVSGANHAVVRNTTYSHLNGSFVVVRGSNDTHIVNNAARTGKRRAGYYANNPSIRIEGGASNLIEFNEVERSIVVSSPRSIIQANAISKPPKSGGKFIEILSDNTTVRRNKIDFVGGATGIIVESADDAEIRANSIEGGAGVEIGVDVWNSSRVLVRNNRISLGPGTSLSTVADHHIENNGIRILGSAGTVVRSNRIVASPNTHSKPGTAIGINVRGANRCGSTETVSVPSVPVPGIDVVTRGGRTVDEPCSTAQRSRSRQNTISSNTVTGWDIGVDVNYANRTVIRENELRNDSIGIRLHANVGNVNGATIATNIVRAAYSGIIIAGADETRVINNSVAMTHTGILIGSETNDYGHFPATGTVIRENLITNSRNATVIGARWTEKERDTTSYLDSATEPYEPGRSQTGLAAAPEVLNNRYVDNRVGVRLLRTVNPAQITVQRNYFQNNVVYSIYNGNEEVVLNASTNEWAGGLPASPDPEDPIRDPLSGVLANGTGGAVSEGAVPGVSNIHFCEESRAHCLDPPSIETLSASEVETGTTDASFDVVWKVSDPGNNLDRVNLTLVDDTDGETEDTASIDVSGDKASGTTRLTAPREDGIGHNYTVELTVTDEYGSTASDTVTVSETEQQTPTATATGTATPTPTPPMVTNGTGGGSGTGPGGSGAGGSGGSGGKNTSGDSIEATSKKSTTTDGNQTVTQTPPATPTETPTETPRVTPTPEIIPGFGVVVWIAAFVLLVGLLARRRRS